MQNNKVKVTGITGKLAPEMDIKDIQGGYAKLYLDMDLWIYKLVIKSVKEILLPSVAIKLFKDLK